MWSDLFAALAIIIILLRFIFWEDKNLRWVWGNLISLLLMILAFYSAAFVTPITVSSSGVFGSTSYNGISIISQNTIAVNSQGFILYVSFLVFWALLCCVLMVKDFMEVRNIASLRNGMQ